MSSFGNFGIDLKTKPFPDLSIIIVNYNTADMLARCLHSVHSQLSGKIEVIVVDNASDDDSVKIMQVHFPWARVIGNVENLGFAKANNQALEISRGTYIYFLNPDTELKQRAIDTAIAFMESKPEVGLAGTRVVNPDGSPQSSIERRYPGERHSHGEFSQLIGDIAWVLGASIIARRSVLKAVGGFDERFFIYGEDLDLCLSVRKLGWAIGFISEALVIHWGGASERDSLPLAVWKKKFDAELLFYEKHYSERTIKAIRRANILQAIWRIATLNLVLPFCGDKEVPLKKLGKYRLALTTFRERKA